MYYPGGTHTHPLATGFSWTENYWCNLVDEHALNGAVNPARPIAISGMLLLCVILAVFWNYFPQPAPVAKRVKTITRFCGLLSMLAGAFLGTLDHDWVINVASFLGMVSVAGTLYIIKKLNWLRLFIFGLVNMALVTANRLIYETGFLWERLPVIQKITFLSVLLWVWLLAFQSRRVKQ